ncbi:MAG TPA: XRE family transcriptional regulator [Lachnospiraceae bacterium]|nr:XRE family transcriptional regulator [Lachnospiraceae bacterium]
MVRLRVAELLEERNLTKYWLWKRLGMSYDNYNKMIKNETHSIRYDIIDSMMKILDCPLEDLFEIIEDDENNKTGTNFDPSN